MDHKPLQDINDQGQTDFGFRQIPAAEKGMAVRGIFNRVAGNYDLMNDLMSGGIHRLWKRRLLTCMDLQPGMRLLDVAGGTGDVAFLCHGALKPIVTQDQITVCDINHEMLKVGKSRAIDQGIVQGIAWVCGNAEALPFPDSTFDRYTIAFGLRNVTDKAQALAEAYRVLKPGGKFLCLEFSHPTSALVRSFYDPYSFHVIPFLGEWVARDRAAYQYLVESIRQFPTQDVLATALETTGFNRVSYENLLGGVAAIHWGIRP